MNQHSQKSLTINVQEKALTFFLWLIEDRINSNCHTSSENIEKWTSYSEIQNQRCWRKSVPLTESDQGKKAKESSPEKLPPGEALGAKWRRRGWGTEGEGEKGKELLKVLGGERNGTKENLNVEKHSAEVSAIGTERSETHATLKNATTVRWLIKAGFDYSIYRTHRACGHTSGFTLKMLFIYLFIFIPFLFIFLWLRISHGYRTHTSFSFFLSFFLFCVYYKNSLHQGRKWFFFSKIN